jgi:hypothetical protein
MSVIGDGGLLVNGPVRRPARFGLLDVAEVENPGDAHWQLGVEHDVGLCEDIFAIQPCPPGDIPAKDPGTGPFIPEYGDPFWLVAGYTCSIGGRTLGEAWDAAERRLIENEARSLERTFWTGLDRDDRAVRQALANNADLVDVTSGTMSIIDGLAALEDFLAGCYPGEGVIHLTRRAAVYLMERHQLERDGKVMRSKATGTSVVVGGGYPGSGPAGVAATAGTTWMFGTGAVKVLRGDTFFTPSRDDNSASSDRALNDQTVYAERSYATLLDCCVGTVHATLGELT